jgi:hypothetical protein
MYVYTHNTIRLDHSITDADQSCEFHLNLDTLKLSGVIQSEGLRTREPLLWTLRI